MNKLHNVVEVICCLAVKRHTDFYMFIYNLPRGSLCVCVCGGVVVQAFVVFRACIVLNNF